MVSTLTSTTSLNEALHFLSGHEGALCAVFCKGPHITLHGRSSYFCLSVAVLSERAQYTASMDEAERWHIP